MKPDTSTPNPVHLAIVSPCSSCQNQLTVSQNGMPACPRRVVQQNIQYIVHADCQYGRNLLRILTSQLAPGETRTEPIYGILDLQISSSPYGDSELAFHVRERVTNSTILLSLYMEASQTFYPPRQSRTHRQAGRNRPGRDHGRS